MQMEWLADLCNVLPLPEAAERLQEGTLPSRAACITFDDGYANNLEIAAPVLKRLDLPATFFITAAAVERGIMWNDLVIEGIRRARGDLDLQDIGYGRHGLVDDGARRAAIQAVITELKYQPLSERLCIAERIFSRAADEVPPRLMMNTKQVAELGAMGFDIGAHTMNHPILKVIPPDDARREIEESRDWVARVVGRPPKSFAYPNGRPDTDFNSEHEGMVRNAGFSVAVSTRWASATRDGSRFSLPRITPWERQRWGFWQRLAKTMARSYIGG
jgi:peptidoglycan/xylan/chitin deacetylase (PgdA/CDA1 family)